MAAIIRQRVLSRWLGDGFAGALGAGILGWGFRKLRDGIRREPQVLDVAKLVAGERYTVVTRPAPNRRERRLERRFDRSDRRARRATAPTRRQRRSAARLARTERRVEKADPTTPKGRRLATERARRRARHEAITTPTPKQRRAVARRDRLEADLRTTRDAALARARRRAPSPRQRTFR